MSFPNTRGALSDRSSRSRFNRETGSVRAITLDPKLEQQLAHGVRQTQSEDRADARTKTRAARREFAVQTHSANAFASGISRWCFARRNCAWHFRRFFESTFADLSVLSYSEIPPRVEIQPAAIIPSYE
jgi:flagellar biosynthesis component FlhA